MIRRCAISVLALATAGTLTACSSSGPGDKGNSTAPSTTSTNSSSTSTSPTGKASVSPVHQPKSVPTTAPNTSSIRKQVAQTSCSSIPGGWENKGTIHNTTAKAEKVKITIFFTTTSGGTVQSYGSTTVSVEPGKTANWSVSSKFPADKNTSCVLRGAGAA